MNKYLIALVVGGLMEQPDFTYCNSEVIVAESEIDAINKYNKNHNCNYFYGTCLAKSINGEMQILNRNVKITQLDKLK